MTILVGFTLRTLPSQLLFLPLPQMPTTLSLRTSWSPDSVCHLHIHRHQPILSTFSFCTKPGLLWAVSRKLVLWRVHLLIQPSPDQGINFTLIFSLHGIAFFTLSANFTCHLNMVSAFDVLTFHCLSLHLKIKPERWSRKLQLLCKFFFWRYHYVLWSCMTVCIFLKMSNEMYLERYFWNASLC